MAEPADPGTVTVRYFAAARAAAGAEAETLAVPADCSVAALVALLGDARPHLATVLLRCSFLLDETAVRDRSQRVSGGSTVDVLPPFAGG